MRPKDLNYHCAISNKNEMENIQIALIAIVVDEYDDAIFYYTKKLNFKLIEDTVVEDGKRWVVLSPNGSKNCNIVLTKAIEMETKHFYELKASLNMCVPTGKHINPFMKSL